MSAVFSTYWKLGKDGNIEKKEKKLLVIFLDDTDKNTHSREGIFSEDISVHGRRKMEVVVSEYYGR
jgi:hypothetical protein